MFAQNTDLSEKTWFKTPMNKFFYTPLQRRVKGTTGIWVFELCSAIASQALSNEFSNALDLDFSCASLALATVNSWATCPRCFSGALLCSSIDLHGVSNREDESRTVKLKVRRRLTGVLISDCCQIYVEIFHVGARLVTLANQIDILRRPTRKRYSYSLLETPTRSHATVLSFTAKSCFATPFRSCNARL